MTPELTALVLAALLQVATFVAYSITAQRQVGRGYAMSPRDTPRTLTGVAGRLQRTMANSFEGLILFGIAVMAVTYSDTANGLTGAVAMLYLLARVLYLPAYVFGWTPWRSLIWVIGLCATVFLLVWSLL